MKILKKRSVFTLILIQSVFFHSCIIQNPKPEECLVLETKIIKITEGSTFDIVFYDNKGDRFYINRGLEQGLILDSLNAKVLNKSVTLHLAKVLVDIATSEHISQLAVGETIIFTEFN